MRKKPTASIGLSKQSEDYRKGQERYGKNKRLHPNADALADKKLGCYAAPGGMIARGKGLARSSGQDLMRGEHVVGGETPSLRGGLTVGTTIHPYDKTGRNRNSRLAADQRSNLTGAPKKPEWATGTGTENMASGTSIFDPVLCELVYRWFCPAGGQVIDPFAGGSVRGIVAVRVGRKYWGCDLSATQIAANEEQGKAITPDNVPQWIVGDALDSLLSSPDADLIFSCPPYADLERYSDDPHDLSTMDYPQFLETYRRIIALACAKLKDNRFACFVVGDVRDKAGFYHNLPGDTIAAFQDAGAILYNEAVLVTAVGSLPIRVGRQFQGGRKLGKTHQNVLVFYKGDPKQIKAVFGDVECGEELQGAEEISE